MTEPGFALADIMAEQCALGALLLGDVNATDIIVETLQARDFWDPRHEAIYRAALTEQQAGRPIDPVTLAERLAAAGDLGRIGGADYLHTLMACVPTAANGPYYAAIVADKARRNRLVQALATAGTAAHNPGLSTDDAWAAAVNAVNAADADHARQVSRLDELLPRLLDTIETAGGTPPGLQTGFVDLDQLLGGLRPGHLILVAGRPGQGKTILLTDIARYVSIHDGATVLFVSLEMSSEELGYRILAAHCGIPLAQLHAGRFDDRDWTRLVQGMATAAEKPLLVLESYRIGLPELRAMARRTQRRYGLALLVVDYLQLIQTNSRLPDRRQQVDELSRGLKIIGMELQVPVLVAAQLNRAPEARADRRPQLADLRESGSLEGDADVVILIYRDDYYDPNSVRGGQVDLIIAKNRHGPSGTVTLASRLPFSKFANLAYLPPRV